MADSSVLLEVIVEGKNIKMVQRDVESLAGSINKSSKENKKTKESTEDLSKARSNYARGEKGVAQISANSTKNFSKMREAMTGSSGLVGAYAVLAANVFALTATFGVLSRAASLTQLEQGLIAVGSAAGANLPGVASQLKEITGAAITTEQAMRATAVAVSAGFSTKQLKDLTEVAKGASIALGRDMGDALDRLVRGTAKLEPEILDELGIIVRLDEATQDYAASIGKTANQLTQFERQQAFLNATIDQGLKKFSTIANVIDPNPYDQLSSAFNDLTKQIVQFLNVGVTPLISFLSQNSFALTGALLLFGTTLVKQIVPAISSVAAAQAKFARAASLEAKTSARVISKEYTDQVKKVNESFKTVPKSVELLRDKLKQGTFSTKELTNAVKNLKRSEDLRFTALKAKGLEASAQKIKEYNETKLLRQETERLLAIESRRSVTGGAGIRAAGVGTGAGLTARGLKEMDKAGGIMAQLGVASKYAGLQFANVGKTFDKTTKTVGKGTAFINAGRVAFTAAGGAARLFGTALLNMIPVIGQALAVFSLFQPFLQPFIDKFLGSKKALAEATKGFESFTTIANNLNKALDSTTDSFDRFFAELKVKSGVLNQVTDALEKFREAGLKKAEKEIDINSEKIGKLRDRIKLLQKFQEQQNTKVGFADPAYQIEIDNAIEKIAALRQENVSLAQSSKQASPEDAIKILESALAKIEGSGLGTVMSKEVGAIQKILDDVAGGAVYTFAELEKAINANREPLTKLESSLESIPSTFSEMRKETSKLAQKGSSEFDSLTGSIRSISNEVSEVFKSGAFPAISELTNDEDLKNLKKNLISAFNTAEKPMKSLIFLGYQIPESVAPLNAILEEGAKRLEENNNIIITSAKNAQRLTAEAKNLSIASKTNASIAGVQFDLEKAARDEKLKGLKATEQNLIATLGEEGAADRLLTIRAEIASINAQNANEGERAFRVTKAQVEEDKRLLNLNNKIAAATEAQFSARQKTARLNAEIEKARAGSSLNVEDEYNLAKDSAEEAKSIEDQKLKLKLLGIDLEYQLLDAQISLEQAKLDRLYKEKKISGEDYLTASSALNTLSATNAKLQASATSAARAQKDANNSAIDANVTLKKLALEEAKRAKSIEAQSALASKYGSMGLTQLENAIQLQSIDNQRKKIEEDLIKLQESPQANSLSIAEKKLELAKLITEQESIQNSIAAERLSKLTKFSTTAGAIGSAGMLYDQAQQARKEINEDPNATPEMKKAADLEATKASLEGFKLITAGIAEDMRKLGPEGELVAAIAEGANMMLTSFTNAFEVMADSSATTADKIQASIMVASSVLSAFAQISKAASDAKIAAVDREIAAEQKRDGKSKESIAKIKQLEAKKEAMKKKAFETDKKVKMATAVLNTAAGITQALASLPPPYSFIMAGLVGAMGAAQLAIISGMTYQGGGSSSAPTQPTGINIGQRSNTVDLAKSKSVSGELAYMRGEQGIGGPENFTPAFMGAKYRAAGGPTAGYVVGEQGPELFVPSTPGTIVPESKVAPTNPTNVNFTITALDASGVEDILVRQRGNIIGMMREAANSYGQPFLEGVDVASYTQEAGGVTRY